MDRAVESLTLGKRTSRTSQHRFDDDVRTDQVPDQPAGDLRAHCVNQPVYPSDDAFQFHPVCLFSCLFPTPVAGSSCGEAARVTRGEGLKLAVRITSMRTQRDWLQPNGRPPPPVGPFATDKALIADFDSAL